jgi:hypothetical protein
MKRISRADLSLIISVKLIALGRRSPWTFFGVVLIYVDVPFPPTILARMCGHYVTVGHPVFVTTDRSPEASIRAHFDVSVRTIFAGAHLLSCRNSAVAV